MKKISIFIAVLLLVQVFFCSCGTFHTSRSIKAQNNNDVTIKGAVAEKDNKKVLIKNADVSLENIKTHSNTTVKTNNKGQFQLIVPKGEYTLTVSAKGYKDYKQSSIKIDTDSKHDLGLIELEREYTAEELLKKPVKEILQLMGNKFKVHDEVVASFYYFYNYDVFPGMDFHFSSDIVSLKEIKKRVADCKVEIDAIQVSGKGKAFYHNDNLITADMDYKECTSIYGKMDCEPSNGAVVSGMLTALGYNETANGVNRCINFDLKNNLEKLANNASGKNGKVKYKDMIANNPKVKSIVIQKDTKPQKLTSETMKDQLLKGYWCTYDATNDLVYAIKFKTQNADNGYKIAENCLYDVRDDELVQDRAMDNPAIFHYKVKEKYLIFIEEGGLKTKYYFTYDKHKIISEKSQYTGQKTEYYQFDSIPDRSELISYF